MIYKIFGQNEGTFSSELDAGLARQDGGHVVVESVITVVTCQPDRGSCSPLEGLTGDTQPTVHCLTVVRIHRHQYKLISRATVYSL